MIPHNLPTLGIEEKLAATNVIESGWVAQGLEVAAFENELCKFFNMPEGHALVVSSGSAAIFLALLALNGKGKKIGLPVYSCSSLRNAVYLVGGQCVYLDCAEGSPNLNMEIACQIGMDILIAPSMFGIPMKIPSKLDFQVIEDIAQSLGACDKLTKIGLRGEIGICSFYATKMITSGGQGGAIISKDKSIIDFLRDYREFDCRSDSKYRFNFQMTDLQAAIGRIQLQKLSRFIKDRDGIFKFYKNNGLDMLDSDDKKLGPVRYRAVMRASDPKKVIQDLAANGIRAIIPIEEKELLDNPNRYPSAKKLSNSTVSLPCYPRLTLENANRIVGIVKGIK